MLVTIIGESETADRARALVRRAGGRLVEHGADFVFTIIEDENVTDPVVDGVDGPLEGRFVSLLAKLSRSGHLVLARRGGNQDDRALAVRVHPSDGIACAKALCRTVVQLVKPKPGWLGALLPVFLGWLLLSGSAAAQVVGGTVVPVTSDEDRPFSLSGAGAACGATNCVRVSLEVSTVIAVSVTSTGDSAVIYSELTYDGVSWFSVPIFWEGFGWLYVAPVGTGFATFGGAREFRLRVDSTFGGTVSGTVFRRTGTRNLLNSAIDSVQIEGGNATAVTITGTVQASGSYQVSVPFSMANFGHLFLGVRRATPAMGLQSARRDGYFPFSLHRSLSDEPKMVGRLCRDRPRVRIAARARTADQVGFTVGEIGAGTADGASQPPFCKEYGNVGAKAPLVTAGTANGISINVSAPGAGGLASGSISATVIAE